GLLTGLLPGLHPNSAGAILIGALGSDPSLPFVLVFMLGMHAVLEFLPSIFLGVPDADTEISVLPGRRLFLEGKAAEAVMVCAVSAVLATAGALLLSPLTLSALPGIFSAVKPWTGWLLLAAAIALLVSEGKRKNKTGFEKIGSIGLALAVFLLAAALGGMALAGPMPDPLFALFVGFFTMPSLLGVGEEAGEGTGGPARIKQQPLHLLKLDFLPYVLAGLLLGGLADLLPGISTPAQIAVFASLLVPIEDARHFLALVASIAASHAAFALTAAASIGVSRVGAVALASAVAPIRPADLPLLLGAFALAMGLGALVMIGLGQTLAKYWDKIDMKALGLLMAVYLVCAVGLTDGWLGLAVLGAASAIGLLPVLFGVRRTHVMGAIIGPSLLHAFGL
ncbi:MAG: tripartite tricarboxylate transporter permease, partial [Candidatus Micrarchaeota archaeon]|nr:tripartite tricarboxylate transporter permease [Candidatus Micrarchaeota archaeon]